MPSAGIVVYSADPSFVEFVRAAAEGTAVEVCERLEELVPTVEECRPAGVLLDFRSVTDGGHAHDRVVEQLLQVIDPERVLMLTDRECPEVFERRAVCSGVAQRRQRPDRSELAEWVVRRIGFVRRNAGVQHTAASSATSVPPETAPSGETVLHGITRRFETRTAALRRMLEELEIAAQHDVTVLLIGETGSGKTYLSRLIHEVSPRRNEPFLPVACGALPAELIESELFGHVKGAFTSAHADKEGKFIAAGRGTILLDEIDVLGLEQQVKLLRVIETGEFEPVGSNRTLKCQARLVVASNLDLEPLVKQGKFRPDLYYRLNMLKFEIPPLRHRKPDIPMLTDKFVEQFSKKHRIDISHIEPEFYEVLHRYPWPGNVRELENVIQRAVIYCRNGVLTPEHLPPHVVLGVAGPANDPSVTLPTTSVPAGASLNEQVAMTEREIIEQTLFKNNYSRTATARELGISRVTLYNKMKKYGLTK